jgi:ATP-binding cassette, subfamily B, bacterial MsbA
VAHSSSRGIFRLLRYLARYTPQAVAAVVLMAAVGLLEAFRLLLIKPIFDNVLHPGELAPSLTLLSIPGTHLRLSLYTLVPHIFHNEWTIVAFALVGSTVLKSLCDFLGTYLVNYAGFGMITDLRDDLYETILRRSSSFFQKHPTATLLSAMVNDIERVQYAMSAVLSDSLQQFFTLIFMIGVVVIHGGKLAWLLLLFVPVVIASVRRIGSDVRRTTRGGQDKLAEIQNILHETITGNRIVKAFNMERWELTRFRSAARRLFRANLRSARAQALSSPLMDAIGAVAVALLLLVGRTRIQHGYLTEGAFFTFIVALFKLYDPVRKFALYYNSFQQAIGASSEIFRFVDESDPLVEKPRPVHLKHFRESIRFDEVSFCYSDKGGEREVLRSVSLEIGRGEIVALVGASGAGKSTLVNLIPRFFDPTRGRILIDGVDLRDVSLRSLREQIGKVTQETILFNDTVRNNIAYGQPDVPLSKVEAAARAAHAHTFISQLPEGYDTPMGERGFRLSGGERQRIAIARALLKDAPILILDEATSALDSESEALVQPALTNLMEGRTVVVIAHRLSTIRQATRIAVMEHGQIAAIGTHEQLLLTSPTYRRLHDLQFTTSLPAQAVSLTSR